MLGLTVENAYPFFREKWGLLPKADGKIGPEWGPYPAQLFPGQSGVLTPSHNSKIKKLIRHKI